MIVSLAAIKARFSTGDQPAQKDYVDLIDTLAAAADGLTTSAALSGGPTAYTATLSGPFGASLAALQGVMLSFTVNTTNTSGACTLNINSYGAVHIKKAKGFDPAIDEMISGSVIQLVYDGTNFQWLNPPAQALIGGTQNLVISNSSTTQVDITADFAVLNGGSFPLLVEAVSVSAVTSAGTGAGHLDAGSVASNTWYYIWLIASGTTTNALISTSSTAPSMPSGYTAKALVGTFFTDGSAHIRTFYQQGRTVGTSGILVQNLAAGTTSYTAVDLSAAAPPIARRVSGILGLHALGGGASNFGSFLATTSAGAGEIISSWGVQGQYASSVYLGVIWVIMAAFDIPLSSAPGGPATIYRLDPDTSTVYLMAVSGYTI